MLSHAPPITLLVNVIFEPGHTLDGPDIVPAVAAGVMVMVFVAYAVPHVPLTAYEMVEVPAVTPFTTPKLLTVALVLLLLHTPPDAVSVNVVLEPAQTVEAPEMAPAFESGLTVILFVTTQPVVNT